MTFAIQMTGNATGQSYEFEPSTSSSTIPQHGASSVPSSHHSTSNSMPEQYNEHFSLSSRQSTSSATTLSPSSLMTINTSFEPNRNHSINDVQQFSHSRSPIAPLPRRRAYSTGIQSSDGSQDSNLVYAPHSYTVDPVIEVPLINDVPEQLSSQIRSYSVHSDSVNSESPSEEYDGSSTVNQEATHANGSHRTKRRRADRTQETLITEKCARDRLALAFNLLRDALPDHLKTIRCGRANFLAETSDWVRSIQIAHEQLKSDNQALRNMLQNCSCGATQQRQNATYLHASPTAYYNSGPSYA